jgi:hypothetical protein
MRLCFLVIGETCSAQDGVRTVNGVRSIHEWRLAYISAFEILLVFYIFKRDCSLAHTGIGCCITQVKDRSDASNEMT